MEGGVVYSVSATDGAASSGVPESEEDNGDNDKGEEITVQGDIPGGGLQQVGSPAALTATTSTAAAVGEGVSTKGRGKAPAKKRGASAASSAPLAPAVDPDVLGLLGVTLSHEGVHIISNLFFKINEFAKRFYASMAGKQLPSSLSGKLSLTERAIWCGTYREMCEDVFVSMCICEYHAEHRPDLVRALPEVKVLSDSPEPVAVPLACGGGLLDFLLRLDCAVRSRVESIFRSYWNEVSVSLEGEALNGVSCGDFISVLDTAGIPEVALSITVTNSALAREISRGTIKRTESGVVTAPDRMPPPPHSEDGSSSDESSSGPIVAGRRTDIVRAPVWTPPVLEVDDALASSSLRPPKLNPLPPVRYRGAEPSSDRSVVRAPVWTPPVLEGDDAPASSTVSVPSYLECAALLGVELHPDSVKLLHELFRNIRRSFMASFPRSVSDHISSNVFSKLSAIDRVVWFRTYRELHLSSFMSRCFCIYHSRYRPSFMRSIADIRVLPGSSGSDLIPLNGVSLVDFLSRLDCVVRDLIKAIFSLRWDVEADRASSELGCVSLSDVSYEDLIRVLGIDSVFVSAFSIVRKYMIDESETLVSTLVSISEITSEDTASGADITAPEPLPKRRLLSMKQLGSSSLLEEDSDSTSDKSSSNIVEDVLVSTGEGTASGVRVLEESASAPISSPASPLPLPSPLSESMVAAVDISSASLPAEESTAVVLSMGTESSLPLIIVEPIPERPVSQRCVISRSKILGSSAGCAEGMGSGVRAIDLTRFVVVSLPRLQLQHELSFQSLPESSFPPVVESVAASVAVDQPGSVSVTNTVSTYVTSSAAAASSGVSDSEDGSSNKEEEGAVKSNVLEGGLQQVESPAATTSTAATAVGKGVSAKSRGKASAKKRGTSATVSSSLTTLDPGILSSLGVTLSPEGVQVIASLFFKIGEFARGVYRSMLDKQLPSSVSDKLSVTGRAIWYYTYSTMCKDFFMSRCISEYHASHRPGFVRALPSIQVVSDSSGHSAFSLAGENLLNFLSNLDGAIHSELESIFNSCFSDVSVSLEEESLSDVSCEDFVDVLNVAGVPKKVLLSTELLGSCVIGGKRKRGIPADNVPPTNIETTMVIRAPVWVPPFANAYELILLSSAGDSRAGTSSDQVAAEGLADDSVPVPTHVETRAVRAPVLVTASPSSAGDNTPSSSTVSIPSYLECADSLGVELHPDSVPLIHSFFRSVHLSIMMSFSRSIRNYISTAMSSVLSVIGRFVWFTAYREQHLYNFISRCLVLYHYKYRPDFIRTLPDIRVLSDSSDLGLQLSGGSLVSFLSRLDIVVRDLISCVFNSQWGIEVDKVCSEIGDGSLDGFGCEDLIYVLDIAGVPESVLSVSQRRKESAKKRKESAKRRREGTPGSSSGKITSEGTASVGGIEGHSLLSQESYDRSPSRSPAITVSAFVVSPEDTGSYLPAPPTVTGLGPVSVSTVFGESSSNISDDVLDSAVEGAASSLDVLEGESLSPLSLSLSSLLSESILDADIFSSSSE